MNKFELLKKVTASSLSAEEKCLLIELILRMNDNNIAWPSVERLCKARGIKHEKNFKGADHYLPGLITKIKSGRKNEYLINTPAVEGVNTPAVAGANSSLDTSLDNTKDRTEKVNQSSTLTECPVSEPSENAPVETKTYEVATAPSSSKNTLKMDTLLMEDEAKPSQDEAKPNPVYTDASFVGDESKPSPNNGHHDPSEGDFVRSYSNGYPDPSGGVRAEPTAWDLIHQKIGARNIPQTRPVETKEHRLALLEQSRQRAKEWREKQHPRQNPPIVTPPVEKEPW